MTVLFTAVCSYMPGKVRPGRFLFVLFLCVFITTGKSNLFAQQTVSTGSIVNSQGQPVAKAKISIVENGYIFFTDSAGNFTIPVTNGKSYTIEIIKEGYQIFKQFIAAASLTKPLLIQLQEAGKMLEEVVLKDNREAARRQTESMNVSSVNRQFIQKHSGGSLMQTLSRLPGIKTIGIGSGQSKPLIRGLGFNRVAVIDKGIRHEGQQWGADHGLEIDQFAINEVELLKGAASFVYGSDAIAGAIDIKPIQPPAMQTSGAVLDITGKSNNNLLGSSVNIFSRGKQLFFDARFTYLNYGDYRVPADSVFVYDYGVPLYKNRVRNSAGREAGLHLNTGYITDKWRSIFYISNSYSKSGFFANAHGLEPRRVDHLEHDANSRDLLLPRQQVNHFKIINRSSFKRGQFLWGADLGYQRNIRKEYSQYVNHGYMPPALPDTLGVTDNLERAFNKDVFSFNLKNEWKQGKHFLKTGMSAEYQHNNIGGWTFLVPAFRQSSLGAFVYDKYAVNEKLILHAALRYDYGRLQMMEYRDWFPSENEAGNLREYLVRAKPLTRHFHSLVWSAGVNYNSGHFELKANAGKSFRMPIAKELSANGVNYHYFSYERGDPSLDPEQSYQADISLLWNKPNYSIKLSPFYNYFPNYIYLNPTFNHDYFYGAGNQVFEYAQSRVARYGAELELKYNLSKSLSAGLLAEYLYARQLSGNKKGYSLPFSVPASALINLSWEPGNKDGIAGTYISVDYCLTAAQHHIVPPEKKTAGYQLVNLQAGTRLNMGSASPFIISIQVQNVFNTRYLNHTSFYRLIELPEAGRNIVLSLKIPVYNSKGKAGKQT